MFVELAKDCVRMCHMLKAVNEESDMHNFCGSSMNRISDLGRYIDLSRHIYRLLTGNIRIMRHIESMVSERAHCAHDTREYLSESTKECVIAWQTEMWEILRVFDVCDS